MAGILLDALASCIQNMLTEMAKEEVHMLLGVSGEIDKLDLKLKDLKKFLADADKRNITDESVQAWVTELRDVFFEATNILDLCQLKAMEQGPRGDIGCLNPLLFCLRNPMHAHDIGKRIGKLNLRLHEIKERSMVFGFIPLGPYEHHDRKVTSSHARSRETSPELDERSLVGEKIEEDTRNLVETLTKEELTNCAESKIKVFAIIGVGGIGKTTLAKKIFNHDIIQQEFQKKIWLSVNQDCNDNELLKRCITEAGGDHLSVGSTKGALERTLKDILKGQKTLLVMDDVWDHKVWESVLKTPLVNVLGPGSRVLITTRHNMVAQVMMAEKPYHHVDKLEPNDVWLLLKKQIVIKNENDEAHIELRLKDIGMEIIAKCDCLPLAVKVMGGLLCQRRTSRREWEIVLNNSIWSVPQMSEELNYAIYLSYEDLHPYPRPCFLHYSLLPKGTVFRVHEIVGMWISEGFIHGTLLDLEEVGKEYYDELIQRNLIEPDSMYIDQIVCNMHDVVRSFAQFVAGNEALVAQNSQIGTSGRLSSRQFNLLSLPETISSESSELEWCSLQAHTSLRTLISAGHIKIKPGDSLLSFSNLRTLHMESANFDALVESLYQLKHLRYLSIKGTSTSRLPESIGKMKLLQFLSVYSCKSLLELPANISKLQQLRYLDIRTTGIKCIPKGFYGLTSLRILYGFLAHMDGEWCSLEELGPLSKLTRLDIGRLENVSSSSFATKATLDKKVRLTHLSLYCTCRLGDDGWLLEGEELISERTQQQIEEVFDELSPPPGLETLVIEGYFGRRFPRWLMSTAVVPLWSLRILTMDDLACCLELPNGLCLLPCLEFLQIRKARAIKCVRSEFVQPSHRCHNRSQVEASFPRLHRMHLVGFVEWEDWEWEEQAKAMPILEKLMLERCKLRRVPPGLAFHARALKKLYIYHVKQLSSLENLSSVVHLHVFRNPDLERISNLPKLQKLIIVECPKLRVLEGMSALQRLNLEDYDMETVPRYMKDVNPMHLLLDCSLLLLTCIAGGKSGPEWNKFSHVQQVKAYAHGGVPRKWWVLFTRDPFRFEKNISRSAIAQERRARTWFGYNITCPI